MDDDAAASMAASERALQVAQLAAGDASWQHVAPGAGVGVGAVVAMGPGQHPLAMMVAEARSDSALLQAVRSLACSPGVIGAIMSDPAFLELAAARGGTHVTGLSADSNSNSAARHGWSMHGTHPPPPPPPPLHQQQWQQQHQQQVQGRKGTGDVGVVLWEYLSAAFGVLQGVADAIADAIGRSLAPPAAATPQSISDDAAAAGPAGAAGASRAGCSSSSSGGGGRSGCGLKEAGWVSAVVGLVVMVALVVVKNRVLGQ
eukprot:TRINITY_DN8374_c0_g5_i1.p1 TRINITY_DN8374_c0_g5~~TRINITY_DN8374_c0_g5_i1.p1  ORF type:complete len:289 (-),score=5.50 TRINITY_DN8374_c0_g5_i1:815-1591(-)